MKKATLKEQFTNIIVFHYERELWYSRPEAPYEESMEPFLNDLISVARRHKQGKSMKLYQYEDDRTDQMSIDVVIGRKIETLRTRKGWTLAQLAKKTRLNVDYLQSIEQGESILRIWALEEIAQAFKVKSSAILPF